jgi:hypothetical protein
MKGTTRLVRAGLLFTGVVVALGLWPSAAHPADVSPWRTPSGTHEVENGSVLENDLLWHEEAREPSGPKFYPQSAVLQWDAITQPGRYLVSVRARTEKLDASTLVLQAWVDKKDGGLVFPTGYGIVPTAVASTPMNGYVFDTPGKWQEFSLEFDVESGKPTSVGLMYLGDMTCAAGTVQVEKSSVTLEKLDLPVSISWARPVKVRYKHCEQGAVELRLTNATDQPQIVEVRSTVITDTEDRILGQPQSFTVPALATISGTVPFAVPTADGGYKAVGELLSKGKVIDRRGDVFAVSDSPFRCMLQNEGLLRIPYLLPAAHPLGLKGFKEKVLNNWDQYVEDCTLAVESQRRAYVTYFEFFAWAREDATVMTEDTDEPYLTGHTFYPVSRKQLLLLNGLMKRHGIVPTAYLNAIPFGWPGFEVMRRRPEWLARGPKTGWPCTQFYTSVMDKYENGQTVSGSVYPAIEVNWDAKSIDGQSYLDYHLSQLLASVKLYGWEAYRYDAAPLLSEHFPRFKVALAKLDPPVGIGNNLGTHCLGSHPSDEWQIYCRDESLMMEEDIAMAFHRATDPHRRWIDWIGYLRQGSHLTRSQGGHYTFINAATEEHGGWYSSALSYAVGGHPWGFIKSPFGDCERFMIQYGSYFWDLRTQMLSDPEKSLSVASSRPLWWEQLASQRVLDPEHRQIIVPLFNPPAGEEVVDYTSVGPADEVKVAFKPQSNEQVTAWLLSPEPVSHRVQLEATPVAGGRLEVNVPRFWGWTNVVFDCRAQ